MNNFAKEAGINNNSTLRGDSYLIGSKKSIFFLHILMWMLDRRPNLNDNTDISNSELKIKWQG